ncbi:hypothetical protein [uncultured Maribacter sp.]|uniref:hypothetical protein n=1 Tax=uncultured Maribacter sp. TaxID=431308 RepID=UPI00262CC5F4|nr:hypothetical protein [uncultured Maribacter sp.]
MGVFNSLNQTSKKAIDYSEEYVQKTQEYYTLKVFQQLAITTSLFCKIAIIGSLAFLSITLLVVAGTLALGSLIGNMVYACLIIALSLLIICAIIYRFREKINRLVITKLTKQFFD